MSEVCVESPREADFALLFERLPNGLACCRITQGVPAPDVRFLYANPAFGRLTGLAELAGCELSERLPTLAQTDPKLFAAGARVLRTGSPLRIELPVRALGRRLRIGLSRPQPQHLVIEVEAAAHTGQDTEPGLLDRISSGVPGMIFEYRRAGDGRDSVSYASAGIAQAFELEAQALRDDAGALWARVHPADVPVVSAAFEQSARDLRSWELQYRVLLPERGLRWHGGLARPERRSDGSTVWHGLIADITPLKLADQANRELGVMAQATMDSLAAQICVLDPGGAILAVNRAWREYGQRNRLSPDWSHFGVGVNYLALCEAVQGAAAEEAHAMARGIRQVMNGEVESFVLDYPCHTADSVDWFSARVTRFNGGNAGAQVVVMHQDITRRRLDEARLQTAAKVFKHAGEGIIVTDAAGIIVDVNSAFTRITGFERDDALGRNPRFLRSGRQTATFYQAMWHDLIGTGYWRGEVWNRRKDGEVYAQVLTISAVRDESGLTLNYVGLFTDITSIKQYAQRLERIIHYDALTRLPNRVLLADRLRQAMAQSRRRGQSLALVYLDLDDFKAVNDQAGHAVGDQVLVTLSQRLKAALRAGDTLARMGGDEFVGVLVDLDQEQELQPLLARMLAAAAEPVQVGEWQFRLSVSIGVTVFPDDDVNAELLMLHADRAMYKAKQGGKNSFRLHQGPDVTPGQPVVRSAAPQRR